MKFGAKTESGAQTPKISSWDTWTDGSGLLEASVPAEFGGLGVGITPEGFMALALANCFTGTFKVFAELSKLEYLYIRVKSSYSVVGVDGGHPSGIDNVVLHVMLDGVKEPDKARASRLLDKVSKSCLMINALKANPSFIFELT